MSGLVHAAAKVEITDRQRKDLVKLLREDPFRPHVAAMRQVGIQGSKGQLRELLRTDEQLSGLLEQARYDYLKTKRLGVDTMLTKLADIAHDKGNPSQLRAVGMALTISGVATSDRQRVEVTGEDGDPVEVTNPDLNAAVDRFTNTIRRLSQGAESGGDVRQLGPGPTGAASS